MLVRRLYVLVRRLYVLVRLCVSQETVCAIYCRLKIL